MQLVRPEFTFGNSRFDFYIEFNGRKMFLEVKGCKRFGPDDKIHPEFGKALRGAQKASVEIFAVDCKVTPDSLVADKHVTLVL